MLFAGLAASAAIDLLSLLQEKASAKSGTSLTAQSGFAVPEQGPVETAQVQPQFPPAASRTETLSRDALDTLLSQGQDAAKHKKRSASVLLDLLQSSQKGNVKKSEFETAIGEHDGGNASELFDRLDQDRDGSINTAEMSLYLDTYKRNADARAKGAARSLASA
jgi:hypothetical protein